MANLLEMSQRQINFIISQIKLRALLQLLAAEPFSALSHPQYYLYKYTFYSYFL